ncbi:hypothetical protein HALLA_05770 [Halostagnicola larsenii XH-48]|uniref:Uncharacterized protein n=1 Tax=Halostagnicola larsenii XH-48 TaxID=797299 RepID=W0JQ38_9EURY|nr:hypothetical protein HALLA_05770 [Halostagnicola larsenii XH-48]
MGILYKMVYTGSISLSWGMVMVTMNQIDRNKSAISF